MPEEDRKPLPNPPLPDIHSLASSREYTGLVPAAVPWDAKEDELLPFGAPRPALPYEPPTSAKLEKE